MAVGYVQIGLQASRSDGRPISADEFVAQLDIRNDEVEHVTTNCRAWAAEMVWIGSVRDSDYAHVDQSADPGAQSEALYSGIQVVLQAAARFLDRRPDEITRSMRTAGLSLRLFIEVGMDQDQMELTLPQELLAACGRHAIGVHLISNDISAAEALSAR